MRFFGKYMLCSPKLFRSFWWWPVVVFFLLAVQICEFVEQFLVDIGRWSKMIRKMYMLNKHLFVFQISGFRWIRHPLFCVARGGGPAKNHGCNSLHFSRGKFYLR